MNHLVAQIKKRGTGVKTFKILSGEVVYELPRDLENPKVYSSDYKLEDDEWFHIPDFSNTDYCIELLKKDFISADYDQIDSDQLKNLKFLCSYQIHSGVEFFYFQRLSSTHYLRKKWFKISDTPMLEKESPLIVINPIADAIYNRSNDTLYFKNLPPISGIFKGISELYKEATKQETEAFLANEFIFLENDYNAELVKIPNRKRISLAMETINSFNQKEKKQIFSYIKDYCKKLKYNDTKSHFSISDEEELKQLLWGIEQRYYTTPVGNERRVANSVSVVTD